jgi:hypothetical protein
MIRRIAASVAAVAMLLVLAAPVMAGGWADIVADAQTTTPPVEGQPLGIGFKVMQHGVTPAPWETATVHFVDVDTGDRIDVVATNDDPNGHFTATATLPHAGVWTWQVTLKDLASDQLPVTISVRTAGGKLPAIDPASMIAAIDRAKSDVRAQLTDQFGSQIQDLQGQVGSFRTQLAMLEAQTTILRDERSKLTTRVATLEQGGDNVPLLAVISLAVLSGATAGFAMAWLAGRPGPNPTVTLSPGRRGADPG